ncbi:MAG: hypothetical protein OXL34_17675 [Gemmatimonadota bacterium]|nr:hypothetical protein [Gemmatimonadota bacterium]
MRIPRALVGAAVLFAATTSQAASQVIPGPNGPVEFIGLQKWDAQRLFDAIRELDPDRPFHACAAVMKMDLGFADAAAFSYMTGFSADSERYTVVVGVEDSSGVRYRRAGSETLVLPETWENLKTLVSEDMATVDAAAQTLHASDDQAREFAGFMGADPETLARVRHLVRGANGEEDRRLAHEVLARDSARWARAAATLVLGNFIDDDRSWHALAGSLIDSQTRVRTVASGILTGLILQKPDPVDWSGARGALSALFGGTNPFAFRDMLGVLSLTGIDPEFGQQLLRENPDLLLAHAGAEHERTRGTALTFLKVVSGEDFGTDVEAWTAWVKGGVGGR